MMKTETSSRVAVSIGSRVLKRIVRPSAERAPTTMTSPSTSSALANSDPMIEVCATTVSPADSAKITMKNSGRLPRVDCRTPVTAGPKRSPTCSVAKETSQASPASAAAATTNGPTPADVA